MLNFLSQHSKRHLTTRVDKDRKNRLCSKQPLRHTQVSRWYPSPPTSPPCACPSAGALWEFSQSGQKRLPLPHDPRFMLTSRWPASLPPPGAVGPPAQLDEVRSRPCCAAHCGTSSSGRLVLSALLLLLLSRPWAVSAQRGPGFQTLMRDFDCGGGDVAILTEPTESACAAACSAYVTATMFGFGGTACSCKARRAALTLPPLPAAAARRLC